MVPLLIHTRYTAAIERLLVLRDDFTSLDNTFVFASAGGSNDHPQGSHEIKSAVNQIGGFKKPDLLTATKFRHRASIMFGSMEASDAHRELFYSHMGHEKSINENVYQHPKAICEVVHVAQYLKHIDGKK